MDMRYLTRNVNEGFSGGEKKRNEILQLAVLEAEMAILDEIDSGLDIDALRDVSEAVNALKRPDRAVLMITHYQARHPRGSSAACVRSHAPACAAAAGLHHAGLCARDDGGLHRADRQQGACTAAGAQRLRGRGCIGTRITAEESTRSHVLTSRRARAAIQYVGHGAARPSAHTSSRGCAS